MPKAMHIRLAALTAALLLALAGSMACRASTTPRVENLSGDPERGRHLMAYYGCGSCHTIPNIPGANTVVGPPLWGMADRGYIGGVLPNTEADMIRWLRDPPAVAPRTAMPNMGVTESDARDISAYLYTLRAEPVGVRILRGFTERAAGRQVPDPTSPEKRTE